MIFVMHGSCIISHDLQSDLIFLFICLFTLYRCDLFVLGVTCVVMRSEFLIACSSFFAWRVLSAFHNGWLFYTLIVRSMSLYLLKFYLKNVLHKFLFIFNSLSKILYRAFVFLLDAFTILTLSPCLRDEGDKFACRRCHPMVFHKSSTVVSLFDNFCYEFTNFALKLCSARGFKMLGSSFGGLG